MVEEGFCCYRCGDDWIRSIFQVKEGSSSWWWESREMRYWAGLKLYTAVDGFRVYIVGVRIWNVCCECC